MKRINGTNKNSVREKWPTITETVHESIRDLEGIVDVTETMKNFNSLQYEEPAKYSAERIVKLRKFKLHMSQPVFAAVCNIKLPTLQKWERGFSRPTPPVNRLFQLVEKGGLDLITQGNAKMKKTA
jgi:putative transcriptional regulator